MKRAPWIRPAKIAGGFLLLLVGFIGLFLPVLQGIAMIAGGLALLSTELEWAKRLRRRLEKRWNAFRIKTPDKT